MKTIGDFITALSSTSHSIATVSIQMWQEGCQQEIWDEHVSQPLTLNGILCLREQMSCFYGRRIQAVSSEEYYHDILDFIQEFDSIAASEGFTITEKRMCISYAEALSAASAA